jgi:Tol biopolymer transport system component
VEPPGGGRGYPECDTEVYTASETDPVFRLSAQGVSYEWPTFSPDGNWLVYVEQVSAQARLRLISTDWQMDKPLTDWFEVSSGWKWLQPFSWSSDSQWLVFKHYSRTGFGESLRGMGKTYLVNIASGEQQWLGEDIHVVAWSHRDPSQLVFAIGGWEASFGGFYLTTTNNLEHPQRLNIEFRENVTPEALAWHPEERALAFCVCAARSSDCELRLIDLSSHRGKQIYRTLSLCRGGLAWHPSGQWLASYQSNRISIYETAQWQVVKRKSGTGIENGGWVGDRFFFYTEYTSSRGHPAIAPLNTCHLIAIAMGRARKEVIWSPMDFDLKPSPLTISWH